MALAMWVHVDKGISGFFEELIDFRLQLTQAGLPSARGQSKLCVCVGGEGVGVYVHAQMHVFTFSKV